DEGGSECLGIELAEILRLLANADEADGKLQASRDSHDDPAFCRAVELGQNESGDAARFVELNGLRQRVLSLVGIQDEKHFMGSGRIDALNDTLVLLELLHQVRLAVEAAGRVREQHADLARAGGLQSIEYHRARIGSRLLSSEFRARALRPDIELLDGGGAERIAGRQHDTVALIREPPCEL